MEALGQLFKSFIVSVTSTCKSENETDVFHLLAFWSCLEKMLGHFSGRRALIGNCKTSRGWNTHRVAFQLEWSKKAALFALLQLSKNVALVGFLGEMWMWCSRFSWKSSTKQPWSPAPTTSWTQGWLKASVSSLPTPGVSSLANTPRCTRFLS